MMKAVSIINYKGGVGKTTITANLAADLAQRGQRVLAIDLDPQTNLTFSFIRVEAWRDKYEKDKTIKFWFDSIIDGTKAIPPFEELIITESGIDLICSHLGLIDVDIELAAGLAAGSDRQHRNNFLKTYSYIKKELEQLNDQYDIILFDCPPNFSIVTKNALIASDYYLVPAKMDYLSTLGINQLRNHVDNLLKQYNTYCQDTDYAPVEPIFLGIVATMIAINSGKPIQAQQTYIATLKHNGLPIFDTMIRENKTVYASAPEYGTPVVMQNHGQNPTHRQVVEELRSLTEEFITKVGLS